MAAAFAGVLVVLAMVWLVVYLVNQGTGRGDLSSREREELEGLRVLLDDLKETAWDHRELDSALSVIILDKIRSFERRRRQLGS